MSYRGKVHASYGHSHATITMNSIRISHPARRSRNGNATMSHSRSHGNGGINTDVANVYTNYYSSNSSDYLFGVVKI